MIPLTVHMRNDLAPPRDFRFEVAPLPPLFSSLVMTSVGELS